MADPLKPQKKALDGVIDPLNVDQSKKVDQSKNEQSGNVGEKKKPAKKKKRKPPAKEKKSIRISENVDVQKENRQDISNEDVIEWGARPGRNRRNGLVMTKTDDEDESSDSPDPYAPKPFEKYIEAGNEEAVTPLLNLPPERKRTPWAEGHPLHGLRLSEKRKNPPGGSMAACLLVKDDLKRLAEWIPYHFHVMPLRDVIVAIDPEDTEDLSPLIDRWDRPEELGMTISIWKDRNYLPTNFAPLPDLEDEWADDMKAEKLADHHINRQRFFFGACVEHMKSRNHTWTLMLDSDEYLIFNTPHNDDGTNQFEWVQRKGPPNDQKRYERIPVPYWRSKADWAERENRMEELRKALPPNGGGVSAGPQPGAADTDADGYSGLRVGGTTVMQHIAEHRNEPPFSDLRPCIDVPRLFFGGVESDGEDVAAGVPDGFDARSFTTLRFRKHATRGAFEYNLYVKTLMDVSQIDLEGTPERKRMQGLQIVDKNTKPWRWWPKQTHKVCSQSAFGDMPVYYNKVPFRAHHYIGSWESYSERKDTRRTRHMYDVKANIDKGSDDDIRPWLKNFAEEFGKYAYELTRQFGAQDIVSKRYSADTVDSDDAGSEGDADDTDNGVGADNGDDADGDDTSS